jgi:hypothetical protein
MVRGVAMAKWTIVLAILLVLTVFLDGLDITVQAGGEIFARVDNDTNNCVRLDYVGDGAYLVGAEDRGDVRVVE